MHAMNQLIPVQIEFDEEAPISGERLSVITEDDITVLSKEPDGNICFTQYTGLDDNQLDYMFSISMGIAERRRTNTELVDLDIAAARLLLDCGAHPQEAIMALRNHSQDTTAAVAVYHAFNL